jgi:Tol biopolymer transport system component
MSHAGNRMTNGWYLVSAALAALVLLSATGCQLLFPPFRRSPDLRLLRSGHVAGGSALSHPIVSPDGAQLYYLSSDHISIGYCLGTLWRTGFNDTVAVQVLADTFGSMAMSSDGRHMVLGTYTYSRGRRLVTLDLGTSTVETIPSAEDISAWDVEFSRTVAGRVYYSDGRTGLHRIDIDGSDEVLVDSTLKHYFDLTTSDSVVQAKFSKPKVDPGGRYVACMVSSTDPNIAVIDLTTGDTTLLRANPYKTTDMEFPYWTPDGKSLIFAAAEWRGEPHGTFPAELWVLDDVFKK